MAAFDSEDLVQVYQNLWLLSVNITYKYLNTVFLKCGLISYDKSGSGVRECSYLSICNAMEGATEFTNNREKG